MKARIAALALCLTTQCMPPIRVSTAFASRFGDNDRARLAAVLERVQRAPAPRSEQALLAAVLQGERREVAVYDVATRRALWSQALAASGTPELVGDALVVETGQTTRILDARTGAQRGQVEHTGLELTGAARDGDRVVLCFSAGLAGGGRRSGRVVAVDASSGGVRWEHELAGLLGRPAAVGGLAFVPWDRQSIAVLDLATGVEQARLRSTDDVLSWVFVGEGGVWYGGRGLYHLTGDSASGTRQGAGLLVNPLQGVPGDPMLYEDGFLATTGTRTARDHIRFGFRPRAGDQGRAALQDDAVYLAYYRHLLAVDVGTGAVRWAQRLEEDVESLTVTARGVFVTSGTGKVRGVDPRTGAVSVVAELNASLGAIRADLEALPAPTGGVVPEGSVREQLVGLVRDADNRLVPFRVWLVGLLGRMPEAEVTRDLLDLYTQRSIPGQLRQGIATALLARRNGAQFLTAALAEHYDYLEGRQAPPLQVLAPALVNMGARDAVPGLLSHLLDHETPLAVLPDVVAAISTLGEASAVPQLQRWVQFYKSDSTFRGEAHVAALNAAADAIFRHGDQGSRAWLRQLSEDASANALLKAHIVELFQREAQDSASRATAQTAEEQRAALETELTRLREVQAQVPQELPEATLDEVWNAHLDELRACAQGAVTRNPALNQIRVVVALRSELPRGLLTAVPPAQSGGTGPSDPRHVTTPAEALAWVATQVTGLAAQRSRVRQTTYSPNDAELRTCMDRVLLALEFPAYRGTRQEFRRLLDTRAARAATEAETYSGLGVDAQGRELPWWLVSAPTLEVVNPPAPGTPAVRTDAGVAPAAVRDAGPSRAPDAGLTGTAGRPWWEEQ